MKLISIFPGLLFLIVSCNNDKVATNESMEANTPSMEKTENPASSSTLQGDGIAGSWKMSLEAWDKNNNRIMEEEERKVATKNNYRLQLNADGTCKIQGIFNGTYKVKEEGNKKILEVQRKKIEGEETKDPIPGIYYITSLTKDEMVLLTTAAGFDVSFWIFKRE